MGRMRFEYMAVPVKRGPNKDVDRIVTEHLNRVAEHGWRLVGLLPQESMMNGLWVFEREVGSGE